MKYTIEELLPHKEPMIFIKDIKSVDVDKGTLTAVIEISETDIIYQQEINGIPSYTALEYMAQAIGCFVGYYDLHKFPDKKPGVGFVLGTRKLTINEPVLFKGSMYYVDVKALFCDENIASFECLLYNVKNETIAEAIVNAYRPSDIQTFMKEYT